jgi:nucleotide-binding universal stress UspA family protein
MYQHILVTLDSSGHSEQILAQLPPIVWKQSSTVHLLSVYPPMRAVVEQQTHVYAHQLESQASIEALGYLDKVAILLRERGLSVTTEVRFGDPVQIILATAQTSAADFLIMPVPWCRGDGHLMTAEVTTQVIRKSPVPVLVVRLEMRQRRRGERLWV